MKLTVYGYLKSTQCSGTPLSKVIRLGSVILKEFFHEFLVLLGFALVDFVIRLLLRLLLLLRGIRGGRFSSNLYRFRRCLLFGDSGSFRRCGLVPKTSSSSCRASRPCLATGICRAGPVQRLRRCSPNTSVLQRNCSFFLTDFILTFFFLLL